MLRIPEAIIGHAEELDALRSDIATENVAHAYLFAGPEHVGKMTVALWFAQELLCVERDAKECASTKHQIERLTYPDLFVLDQLWMEETCEDWAVIARTSNVPQTHRAKSGAKTDTISIDDVRALQERLYETGLSRYRCCVIRSVERMQDNAANAFLKILEEPPAGLTFVLTATSPGSLLPTIVSRSRVLAFRRLSERDLLPLLTGISEDDRRFILALAQGAPGILRILADDPDTLRAHRLLQGKAAAFWNTPSLTQRLQHLSPLLERGEESEQFLLHLALALRQNAPVSLARSRALVELLRGLETNAHRGVLVQRFALEVS